MSSQNMIPSKKLPFNTNHNFLKELTKLQKRAPIIPDSTEMLKCESEYLRSLRILHPDSADNEQSQLNSISRVSNFLLRLIRYRPRN